MLHSTNNLKSKNNNKNSNNMSMGALFQSLILAIVATLSFSFHAPPLAAHNRGRSRTLSSNFGRGNKIPHCQPFLRNICASRQGYFSSSIVLARHASSSPFSFNGRNATFETSGDGSTKVEQQQQQQNCDDDIDTFHRHEQEQMKLFERELTTNPEKKEDGAFYDPLNLASSDITSSLIPANTGMVVVDTATTTASKNRDIVANDDAKKKKESEIWLARILLLAAAALYGTNFTLVKILDEHLPVGASAMMRFSIAAFATLPWLIMPPDDSQTQDGVVTKNKVEGEGWNVFGKHDKLMAPLAAGFEVGLWNSIGYIAQAVGLETTDASKSAFICSLAVVVVPLMDSLFGKTLSKRAILGAILAVGGVGLLELGGATVPDLSSPISLSSGDIASFLQPLAFGMGFWRMEAAMRSHPTEASRLTAAQLFAIGMASIVYCLMGGGGVAPPTFDQIVNWLSDPVILGALAWTGAVTTAFTVYMETLALRTLTAAEATVIFSTEPLWGAAFAGVVMGERFGVGAALGAVLILAGCVCSGLGGTDHETEEKQEGEQLMEQIASTGLSAPVVGSISVANALVQIAIMEEDIVDGDSFMLEEAIKVIDTVKEL